MSYININNLRVGESKCLFPSLRRTCNILFCAFLNLSFFLSVCFVYRVVSFLRLSIYVCIVSTDIYCQQSPILIIIFSLSHRYMHAYTDAHAHTHTYTHIWIHMCGRWWQSCRHLIPHKCNLSLYGLNFKRLPKRSRCLSLQMARSNANSPNTFEKWIQMDINTCLI